MLGRQENVVQGVVLGNFNKKILKPWEEVGGITLN